VKHATGAAVIQSGPILENNQGFHREERRILCECFDFLERASKATVGSNITKRTPTPNAKGCGLVVPRNRQLSEGSGLDSSIARAWDTLKPPVGDHCNGKRKKDSVSC